MAQTNIKSELKLDIKITMQLTLQEARAINEMVKYGADVFLQGYYKHLGKSYLQPHENGIRTFFQTIRSELPFKITKIDKIINEVNYIKGIHEINE